MRTIRKCGVAAAVLPLLVGALFFVSRGATVDRISAEHSSPNTETPLRVHDPPTGLHEMPELPGVHQAGNSAGTSISQPDAPPRAATDQASSVEHKAAARPVAPVNSVKKDASLELNSVGVAKSSQFASYSAPLESTRANIAFFMQISASTILLVSRLVDKLWHENNLIVIHLDAKIPDFQVNHLKANFEDNPKYSNVIFMEREPITYMGITMLLNTLSAMELLLKRREPWDYFINLSGSDYPTISVDNLRRLLGQPRVLQQRVSFMQLAPNKVFWRNLKSSRFDVQYFDTAVGFRKDVAHTLLPTYKRHPLRDQIGIEFVQAEAWIIAHRSLVEEATRSSFARKLLILVSSMKDPEEHFFPMLAWNQHHLNKTLAHHALRGVYWHYKGRRSGQHPLVIDNANADGSFEFWDPRIKNAPAIFVRKFRVPHSPLMDLIDQYKSGAHPNPVMESVSKSFATIRFMTLCNADIERHWNSDFVVPCFKGGNLKRA